MKKAIALLLSGLFLASCSSVQRKQLGDGIFADLHTNKGHMVVKLHYQQAPVTVANFMTLAEGTNPFVSAEYKGKKYYDGINFHRIIPDFMIQGGDPTGTGSGTPGYRFKDEFSDSLLHDKKGVLSMANAGFGTNGSQFFITLVPTPHLDAYENGTKKLCELPNVSCHAVFGEVVQGLEVLDSIAAVKLQGSTPVDPVIMEKVEIIRNGRDAKKFDAVTVLSNYFKGEEDRAAALARFKEETAAKFMAQKDSAITTASGLKYIILKPATGPKPKIGETVMVNYSGWLQNGELFDTSIREVAEEFGSLNVAKDVKGFYQPVPMKIDPSFGLIAGFKEGLFLVGEGETIRLFIPAHLGYGSQGSGPIPPDSDLIFDLEITEIQKD